MARQRYRQSAVRLIFTSLLVVSLIAIFLPRAWTSRLINLVQVLLPLQDAANTSADAAAELLESSNPVTRSAYEQLQREREALRNQVASLSMRLGELEDEVRVLAKTRLWEVDGEHIGTQGQLVPARVVAKDLVSWRDARVISTGGLQGVRRGDAVTSQTLSIDQGSDGGLQTGFGVLLGEVLIGTAEDVGTQASRVRLFSDPAAGTRVRIGRFTADGFAASDRVFWMSGRGDGRMHIDDVQQRDTAEGIVQIGDVVLSDRGAFNLPVPLTIGTVESIEPDRENPLLVNVTVVPAVDLVSLRKVYVFVPERVTAD